MAVPRNGLRRWAKACCAVFLFSGITIATSAQGQNQPDNSGNNKGQQITADQQSGHKSDRELTAEIRRSLIADKSLSMYGHNVKIITRGGAVTLKGPVHSEDEKQAIDQKAAAVVGQDRVTDHLTVKQ